MPWDGDVLEVSIIKDTVQNSNDNNDNIYGGPMTQGHFIARKEAGSVKTF